MKRSATRHRARGVVAVVVSAGLHAALIATLSRRRAEPPPEPPPLMIELLDLGKPEGTTPSVEPPGPEKPPAAVAAPQPAQRPPRPAKARETPQEPAPEPPRAPPTVVASTPEPSAASPDAQPPSSFLDWEEAHRAPFPGLIASEVAENRSGASDRGVDRCEPPEGRRFEVLYLLFDSSASMSQTSGPNAFTCAHQYAKAAIADGASVVIVNFARGATFQGPTRSMLDVEVALRQGPDPTATLLPSQDLGPFLDGHADGAADLVIVSDGIFPDDRKVLTWYRYFLELNPDNRGRMFTVNGFGRRESVATLRSMGFDVHMYDPLGVD